MKLMLIIAAVLAGIFLWRSSRRMTDASTDKKKAVSALDMVRCDHCSVYVPAIESVPGAKGVYCSAVHRQRAES
jgi:hypothetical protein